MSRRVERYPLSALTMPPSEHTSPSAWPHLQEFLKSIGDSSVQMVKAFDTDPDTYGTCSNKYGASAGSVMTGVDISEAAWGNALIYKAELVFKVNMSMWPFYPSDWTLGPFNYNIRCFFLNSGDPTWGIESDGYTYKYGISWWMPGELQHPRAGWPNAVPKEVFPNISDDPSRPDPVHTLTGAGETAEVRVDITGKSFAWLNNVYFTGENTFGENGQDIADYLGMNRAIFDIYSCFLEITYQDDRGSASATLSSCG